MTRIRILTVFTILYRRPGIELLFHDWPGISLTVAFSRIHTTMRLLMPHVRYSCLSLGLRICLLIHRLVLNRRSLSTVVDSPLTRGEVVAWRLVIVMVALRLLVVHA